MFCKKEMVELQKLMNQILEYFVRLEKRGLNTDRSCFGYPYGAPEGYPTPGEDPPTNGTRQLFRYDKEREEIVRLSEYEMADVNKEIKKFLFAASSLFSTEFDTIYSQLMANVQPYEILKTIGNTFERKAKERAEKAKIRTVIEEILKERKGSR